MVPAGPSTWNETKITNPKGARKPSSNQQEKAQNQSSPDKIEELATHIRYDLNRFRLKSWLKILRNNQLWREIVSKKCFKVMRRWVTHGHCLPPIGVSEVIQDLWLVITYTSLFPTWYISPVQAKCTQIWVTNFENQNHQSFFPCLPNSPPTQKKYPRERCFKQIYFGETKAFTNDKAKLEKNAKGHKVGPNLALLAGNVHRLHISLVEKGGFPLLWLDYGSVTYENSTTVPASSKWPGWIPQIEVTFSLLKGSLKKLPKWVTTRRIWVLAPWHVRFKASYRQCMAIGTSQREGSKLPGVLEATAGDLWSWYNWATKMGTKSPLRHLCETFPFQATSPPVKIILADTPWLSYGWLSGFLFPPTSKNPLREPSILGLDGMLTSSSLPGMWQVVSSVNPQFVASWVLILNTKAPHEISCKRCPGKRNHIFKWCASRNCWVSSITSAIFFGFPQILTVQKQDDEHHLSENSVSCFYLWRICPLKSAAPKQISKRTCANCITSTTTIDTCFSPPFHFQSKSRVIWFGNQMERRWTKSKLVLEQSNGTPSSYTVIEKTSSIW